MAEFKLFYFNICGRAELTRLIFAASETDYEDTRFSFEEWPEKKATFPMGQVPVLKYKGSTFIQSLTIARLAAKKCGLAGKDEMEEFRCEMIVNTLWTDINTKVVEISFEKDEVKKQEMVDAQLKDIPDKLKKLELFAAEGGNFFLGDKMSYADLALMDIEPWIVRNLPGVELPEKLKSIVAKTQAHPKVAVWLEKRPKTPF
jgi:glutathione S-transferase